MSSETPSMRFASVRNSHSCSATQLRNIPKDADAFFIGSSRIRRGISAEAVESHSEGALESAWNLGRPSRQALRSYSIVAQLVKRDIKPKVVVVEVDLNAIRLDDPKGWTWKQDEAGFLSFGEIFNLPGNAFTQTPGPGFALIADGFRKKLKQMVQLHLTGTSLKVFSQRNDPAQRVCWNEGFDVQKQAKLKKQTKQYKEVVEVFGDPSTSFDTRFREDDSPRRRVELEALSHIRQLARANGIHLVVIRPQAFAEPPLSSDVVSRIQALIPEFRYPPEALVRELSDKHIDRSHFGPEGRELYSKWLAETILGELSPS